MSVNERNTVLTAAVSEKRAGLSPVQRLLCLTGVAVVVIVLFMTINLGSNLRYILTHRGLMLTTMLLVAFAASASTVLFQTVTNNRVLTPSIMGFEALFILIQTSLVFTFGIAGIPGLGIEGKFVLETLLLIIFSALLYRWLFTGSRNNLHLVLLVGIICGTLFRSMAGLMQRLLTPGEFAILQGRMFATFTRTVPELVALSVVITLVVAVVIWRMRFRFDVLALGRNNAINLGIDYKRSVTVILLLVSVLVAISTALVGPLTFLGFMVANLAYLVIGSSQHRLLLPAAFLLGVISLVGGQLVLEHLLDMSGALSVVIEFVGGSLFIVLLLKKVSV
ncbi:iron chelate uptake ABC transporter family permease subunit [Pectobacterium atrosepticum]|uniref:iron chelate uptake ABC transporter family permease subunit n=1 Tax=Pectobacterium atrosepticum TaxID=29471 RepID=UPI0003A139EE|nr:iron chelate uptake ABC transporter family permease subunit [Pectobacterium atrosepticum]GKV85113.1 enterobactin ABC transporter permease [Pectobacterium carotovorum subsp. carotovorum]AIA71362.1 enterobactin ABC transporter permease [Pectobacterium atrosepticum]AIK13818.1 putative iron ABC transporter permease component [Pectobacterium atrosepticum]ATY90656.1 enterobactin ABC transporter permease [Pectobacterium atrosepticum]KFX16122.1 enterobactin ABC transporter permease [Pectobacterium 